MSTSATGGYLPPTSTGGDLNDQALRRFLQQIVVNVTGLDGTMVRPRWQAEPPNIPDPAVDWCAIGPGQRERDPYPYLQEQADGSGAKVVRNRVMEILCTFYGPNAEQNTEYLAQGLAVPQNRELMQLAGFNVVAPPRDSMARPIQIKQRWYYAVDMGFRVRQQMQYTFAVLDVTGVQGELIADDQGRITTKTITVNPPA